MSWVLTHSKSARMVLSVPIFSSASVFRRFSPCAPWGAMEISAEHKNFLSHSTGIRLGKNVLTSLQTGEQTPPSPLPAPASFCSGKWHFPPQQSYCTCRTRRRVRLEAQESSPRVFRQSDFSFIRRLLFLIGKCFTWQNTISSIPRSAYTIPPKRQAQKAKYAAIHRGNGRYWRSAAKKRRRLTHRQRRGSASAF